MATTNLAEQICDEILQCTICCETFQTPKTLPCLHSFCRSCLETWSQQTPGVLSCPVCRKTVLDTVQSLPTNFTLEKLNRKVEDSKSTGGDYLREPWYYEQRRQLRLQQSRQNAQRLEHYLISVVFLVMFVIVCGVMMYFALSGFCVVVSYVCGALFRLLAYCCNTLMVSYFSQCCTIFVVAYAVLQYLERRCRPSDLFEIHSSVAPTLAAIFGATGLRLSIYFLMGLHISACYAICGVWNFLIVLFFPTSCQLPIAACVGVLAIHNYPQKRTAFLQVFIFIISVASLFLFWYTLWHLHFILSLAWNIGILYQFLALIASCVLNMHFKQYPNHQRLSDILHVVVVVLSLVIASNIAFGLLFISRHLLKSIFDFFLIFFSTVPLFLQFITCMAGSILTLYAHNPTAKHRLAENLFLMIFAMCAIGLWFLLWNVYHTMCLVVYGAWDTVVTFLTLSPLLQCTCIVFTSLALKFW